MKPWLKKLEIFVDRIIPYLLIILIGIIIMDIFFHDLSLQYHNEILYFDYFLITVFAIDLIFKYNHVRKIDSFLKTYWLDIIAIMPFFLIFRIIEEGFLLSEEIASRFQRFMHTGIAVEEEAALLTKAERAAQQATRTERLARIIRPAARMPRFLKAFHFFEKPGHKH